jgi:acetyl-CoA carboxylase biotin carboxyl carrier protein
MSKISVKAPVGGSVWTHSAGVDQCVNAGTVLLILECMKCEIPVETPVDGTVTWLKACGDTVEADEIVAILEDS